MLGTLYLFRLMFRAIKDYLLTPVGSYTPAYPRDNTLPVHNAFTNRNPHELDESRLDFVRPSKMIPITEEMENRRRELLSRPVEVLELMAWVGFSLEDVWNSGRKWDEKIWNNYTAVLCSWMTVGNFSALAPPGKVVMADILHWWAGGPENWKNLIEPIVQHWKIWAYYPDQQWYLNYDHENVGYNPLYS